MIHSFFLSKSSAPVRLNIGAGAEPFIFPAFNDTRVRKSFSNTHDRSGSLQNICFPAAYGSVLSASS